VEPHENAGSAHKEQESGQRRNDQIDTCCQALTSVLPLCLPTYCGNAPDDTKPIDSSAYALTELFNQPYTAQCTCCRCV